MGHESRDPGPAAAPRARRAPSDDGLVIVGLIGRAGSGKTTVANRWKSRGARILEADRIGHEVTDSDPDVHAALMQEYGADVYRADGTLDRARVAAKVFRDPEALERLDRLVHPHIQSRLRDAIVALRDERFRGLVVIDAALLLRWGFERECDAVVAVVASETHQVERLVASRGWSEAQARERLAVQLPEARLTMAADAVIENDGAIEHLLERGDRQFETLMLRAKSGGREPRG